MINEVTGLLGKKVMFLMHRPQTEKMVQVQETFSHRSVPLLFEPDEPQRHLQTGISSNSSGVYNHLGQYKTNGKTHNFLQLL